MYNIAELNLFNGLAEAFCTKFRSLERGGKGPRIKKSSFEKSADGI
ncbi:hypothetical protein PM10SUCC1_15090 [Propionigenium maris DSM 9537]|uniref:Uncharacterized protein n=1 Tax=Propionigenium maris DSM 9537 TaxID=1123000 RepID=A0A9W6GL77_9FUSO|nr:hypothetical protein [Propionigenium maris]GLI55995.1 hypothetical protein PM10SUCC1_15090 [Propionigenium maris DSM 9537]